MLTSQVQILFCLGNTQLVSCSVFVPVPSIVVKSHQTLEAILPYLPLPLLSSKPDLEQQDQLLLGAPESEPSSPITPVSPVSQSLVLSRPSEAGLSVRTAHSTTHHNCSSGTGQQSGNRICPESSIPAVTCVKISLHPIPSLRFVKPKCPHLYQKQKNQRHFRQQEQQQQQQDLPPQHQPAPLPQHSRSHSRSHSHCRHRTHSHPPSLRRSSTMLEHRIASTPETVIVTFTYPFPSSNSSTDSSALPQVVQVTGNFNAWQRTEPLRKNEAASRFEGEISIVLANVQDVSGTKKKVLFKFVLDGNNWVTDPAQEVDRDYAGNLNNVLFVDTRITSIVQSPESEVPPATKEETEEERLARIKQEEEDDAIIRELGGGGMWGAPVFDVNSPQLPEHFAATSTTTTVEDATVSEESDVHVVPAETPAIASHVTDRSVPEKHEDVKTGLSIIEEENTKQEEEEDEDDKVIKELAHGMWGTPHFQVNDSAALPEHIVEALAASNPGAKINTAAATFPEESASIFDGVHESVTQVIEIVKNAESVEPVPSLTNSRTNSAVTATESIQRNDSKMNLDEAGVGFESHKEDSVVLLQSYPNAGDAAAVAKPTANNLTITIPEKPTMVSMTAPSTPISTTPPTSTKSKRWSMSSVAATISRSASSPTTSSPKSDKSEKKNTTWRRVKKALS
ncbi:hypothetical protein BGX34_003401 [Mortierella sp. NVP85]|nr:hypothetical protein BGX34_003401 [Mortierella sp. NVP85]